MLDSELSQTEQLIALQKKLSVLSQENTLELLYELNQEPTYMKALAETTGIPYTTVQKRVNDLADANLIQIMKQIDAITGKSIKKIRVNYFQIQINMQLINQLMEENPMRLILPK